MTVEFYDAAQRWHAAHSGVPVWQVERPMVDTSPRAVAVRATAERDTVVVGARGESAAKVQGAALIDTLGAQGVSMEATAPPSLIVADHDTVNVLARVASEYARDSNHDRASVAEAVAWCCERADFPGSTALIDLADVTATVLRAGVTPDLDRSPETWREWLRLDGSTIAQTFRWVDVLAAGAGFARPSAWLDPVRNDDVELWQYRKQAVSMGWSHDSGDSLKFAATGLRSRCDAADLWNAALLDDALYRRRAVHTGHVVAGVVTKAPVGFAVECERLDARMRAGTEVIGWVGVPDANGSSSGFSTTVRSAAVQGSSLRIVCDRAPHSPHEGSTVALVIAPPSVNLQTSARRKMFWRYGNGQSWLATGRTPQPKRRDVPLAVAIAAAQKQD